MSQSVALTLRAIAAFLAALAVGHVAFVVAGYATQAFVKRKLRWFATLLYFFLGFFGTSAYVFIGVVGPLLSTDALRLFRFLSATAIWLGVAAGGAWVLWLRGDPDRVFSWRIPVVLLAGSVLFAMVSLVREFR